MAISSPGVGSGIDVSSIISKLMEVESQPLTALATREASYQAKLTAYGGVKGALSAFQGAVKGLNDPAKFQSIKATSSDVTIATASASSSAATGTYALDITALSQAQKLVAAGRSSMTAAIGSGASTTLTFDFGTISGGALTAYDSQTGSGGTYAGATFTSNGSGVKTVTIDSSNNSLAGIRDAINKAKIGVTASVVNDGGSSPYRLVLSSDAAGKASSLKIGVSGDATLSGMLSQDPAGTQNLQQTLAGQNTEMTVNGVYISKANATLTDVIEGVTLSALKVGKSTVSVVQDTSGVSSSVSAFVKAYNDLNKSLKDISGYDAENKKGAILQGDSAVRTIQSQLRSLMGSALTSGGAYTNLSQIGITFQADGAMAVNTSKLNTALAANPTGVAGVFAAVGSPTDSLVGYAGSTTNTKAGNYAVSVTQLATQGKLVGGSAIGSLTITAGVNDALSVTVDGVTTSVTLSAKTYTSNAELATELQSRINGASAFSSAKISVSVLESAGTLTVTSAKYGSASAVAVAGNGASNLLGSATATAGLDVAGTIGGATATGSGQYLTGEGADAGGLQLLISGGVTGTRGTVSFSRGYAAQLDDLIAGFLDSAGTLTSKTEGIAKSIKDIDSRREVLNRRLADIEERYRKQFTALDTLISNMNQTSTYLSQQLANLPKIGS